MKLKRSGYPQSFRHQVIKAAVEKWEKMCQEEANPEGQNVATPCQEAGEGEEEGSMVQIRQTLLHDFSPTHHILNCRGPHC